MKIACPYCGVQIGHGWPTHLTPVRCPRASSSAEFKAINVAQLLSLEPRPGEGEIRVIEHCPADACKAAAAAVAPKTSRPTGASFDYGAPR
jgi:hypothetical protein